MVLAYERWGEVINWTVHPVIATSTSHLRRITLGKAAIALRSLP